MRKSFLILALLAGSAHAQTTDLSEALLLLKSAMPLQESLEQKLARCAEQLDADDISVREQAVADMIKLGAKEPVRALAWLQRAADDNKGDPEIVGRLAQAIKALRPEISASMTLVGQARIGTSPVFELQLENLSDRQLVFFFPAQDFPHYSMTVVEPDGKQVPSTKLSGGGGRVPGPTLFGELEPGHQYQPLLAPSDFLGDWKPEKPGRHVFRLTFDYSLGETEKFMTLFEQMNDSSGPPEEASSRRERLSSMAPQRPIFAEIIIDVEP